MLYAIYSCAEGLLGVRVTKTAAGVRPASYPPLGRKRARLFAILRPLAEQLVLPVFHAGNREQGTEKRASLFAGAEPLSSDHPHLAGTERD
eukprot:1187857-Prorocentrum_minimum.AAC.2